MLPPGNTVIGGDFRVLRPLAAGGMGGVYLAEQLSTGLGRALKLMHPNLVANPRLRERFEQEARIGGRVPSGHVVQIIAAGVDPSLGVPWLAMELLEGEDLAAFAARRGPVPFAEVLPIFRQLCHALGAAHSVSIVHRDVKPENVFLARVQSADSSWQVKVLDFGIAKLHADAQQSATAQVGTPLWMAPEQSDPRQLVTPAADVWPLGLMAFRLLTGRHYWRAASDPSAALSALLRESLVEPLVAASERAREYGAEQSLPPGFDGWFARAVAREPGRRFEDARQAFAALEALEALGTALPASFGSGISAPSLVSGPPAGRRSSTLPLVLGLGAALGVLVVLVIALGAGAYLYQSSSGVVATGPASASSAAGAAPDPAGASSAEPQAPEPGSTSKRPAPGGKGSSAPAAAAGDAGTPSASSKPGEKLEPFDKNAAQSKVNAAAAAASAACAKDRTPGGAPEAFSGTCGFRPDGSRSTFMQGVGGARACVLGTMSGVRYGKYAHPDEWHVETVPFTVTVK